VAVTVAPALSTRNRVLSLSLLQVRTLPSRAMTSNRARHELIQLPTIFKVRPLPQCQCSAHADNRGPSRGRSPIWPETGTLPRPRPRFVRNRGLSPVPVPDLAGTGTLPRASPIPIGGSAPCPGPGRPLPRRRLPELRHSVKSLALRPIQLGRSVAGWPRPGHWSLLV
jgi:hypothetical protein